MSIVDSILELLRNSFPDGQGEDQDTLASSIGSPVDVEITRIDQIDTRQDESLSIHEDDIGFMKAQIDAIINGREVPISTGGIPPKTTPDGPTTEPILQAPEGTYLQDSDAASDIVVSRLLAGKTSYTPQIIGDSYRKVVEDAIQIVIGIIIGQRISSPITITTDAEVVAQVAINKLRAQGYNI